MLFQEGEQLPWWKFRERLEPAKSNVIIPTLFQLVQLEHNINELGDSMAIKALALGLISKDLNHNPWDYSIDGERLANFNQLTSATLKITKLMQKLANIKALCSIRRDDIKTLLKMHEKIENSFVGADHETRSREARGWKDVDESAKLLLSQTENLMKLIDMEITIAQALSAQVSVWDLSRIVVRSASRWSLIGGQMT